jgi:hypothetical protein
MKHDWVFRYEVTVLYQRREFMRKAKPTKPETERLASRDTARRGQAEAAATDAASVEGQPGKHESAAPLDAPNTVEEGAEIDQFLFMYFGLREPVRQAPRSRRRS